ncbi:hypothetical protein MESS2_1000036 [Mesorhizobium metallidurans STM 2683]|uniref:Uncharacterized protein n=1 Tax=Mesorhizobium metallidurans STM 2683 TaxID=1297569 RepID=M5EFB1_9HYPH|nr:hypothetical protein MESS2_1000036 [Mesorhizobium metallidurans STM 2683]
MIRAALVPVLKDRLLPPVSRAYAQDDIKDGDIFRVAPPEYMKAEYYLRGSTGKGIDNSNAGPEGL